jgi:hypothetical protein
VASEDTVLFTAEAYVNNMPTETDEECTAKEAAKAKLAPLIRCPHLSQFWVAAAVLSEEAINLLLEKVENPVKQLLIAMQAAPGADISPTNITDEVEDAPASWVLPRRVYRPLTIRVQVQWTVPVAEVQATAQASAAKQGTRHLVSPLSAPLGGIQFRMKLKAAWDKSKSSCTIGLYVEPEGVPAGMPCHFAYELQCTHHRRHWGEGAGRCKHGRTRGFADYFCVGPMAGGWDEARWSSEGLPTTGELTFKMLIKEVGHWRPPTNTENTA